MIPLVPLKCETESCQLSGHETVVWPDREVRLCMDCADASMTWFKRVEDLLTFKLRHEVAK